MILALPARAKLNLDLRVLGKRSDGFHDLETTMQAIDLHDLVEISPSDETSLTVTGLKLADQAGNSVLTAQRELAQAANRALNAHFHVHKRIPPGSGLGGASSDAATVLRALKQLHQLDVDLSPVAQRVGADVPFFLDGGLMRATGRGERLAALPMPSAWFAIAWPGIELPTAAVYRAWDELRGTQTDAPNALTVAAMRVDPRVEAFAAKLNDGWQMTGSGSAFFKRCESEADAQGAIRGLDCWTAVAHAVGRWS